MDKRLEELTANMEKLREITQPVKDAENRLRENRVRVLEHRQRQRIRTSARGKRGKRRKRKKTFKK